MTYFILRRLLLMIPTLLAISLISFLIIELPPGDFLTTYAGALEAQGGAVQAAELDALRSQYGLDQPWPVRYVKWLEGIVLRGDFGYSFQFRTPVADLLADRLPLTVLVALSAIVFSWVVALPIGIYSALHKYSLLDYFFTFLGFIGLAVPNFLIALVLLYVSSRYLNLDVGGLFSSQYQDAPWGWAKVGDLLKHLWIPTVIVGTAGTAGLIRITRANLLDELNKPYVETARAKGLHPLRLILKYPVRIALNPFFSSLAFVLPAVFSGEVIVSVVLNLPTTGPLLLDALLSQDMYLSGSLVMILAVFTVIGVLLSDLLLAWLDPRIRYG